MPDHPVIPILPAPVPIHQWSISKAKIFGQCKLRAQLQYGAKIPEPERPLPPGKLEHANDRGTRLHTAAERFVQGLQPLIPELSRFSAEFDSLRQLYIAGKVSLEGEWAVDDRWEATGWNDKNVWLRLKLDAMVQLSEIEATVIDYKSGRKFGNEVAHAEQTQLYALATFLRYPSLEFIHTELWYLDLPAGEDGAITQATFTRAQALRFKDRFTKMGMALTTCTQFPPSPNIFNCKWCPYGPKGTGHCTKGV
jgi:hypothetical protein